MKNTENNKDMNEDPLSDDDLDQVVGGLYNDWDNNGIRARSLRSAVRRAAPKAIIDSPYRKAAGSH